MVDVIVYHHAQGCTEGIQAFADELRAAGHTVTVPDQYDGATFPTVDEGVAHAKELGFERLTDDGVAQAADLPSPLVTIGFSLGIMPAQQVAQTRAGVAGCVLFHDAVPAEELGGPWPDGVALQVHLQDEDPWADPEGAAALVASAADGELFTYPGGAGHLVADSSLPSYDPAIARPMVERTLAFLGRF